MSTIFFRSIVLVLGRKEENDLHKNKRNPNWTFTAK